MAEYRSVVCISLVTMASNELLKQYVVGSSVLVAATAASYAASARDDSAYMMSPVKRQTDRQTDRQTARQDTYPAHISSYSRFSVQPTTHCHEQL